MLSSLDGKESKDVYSHHFYSTLHCRIQPVEYGKERRKNGKKEERGEGKGGKEEERTGRKGGREGRKEREEIKGIKIGKEEIKLSLLTEVVKK